MNNPLIEWLDKSDWNNFHVPSRDAARFNRMLRNEFVPLYCAAKNHRSKSSVLCKRYNSRSRWFLYMTAKEFPIGEVAEYNVAPTSAKILADVALLLSVKYPNLWMKGK